MTAVRCRRLPNGRSFLPREMEDSISPGRRWRGVQILGTVVAFANLLTGVIAAQTISGPPKALGVIRPGVRRSMSDLRPLATFEVGGDPDWMAVAPDSVWVTSERTNRVIRLD